MFISDYTFLAFQNYTIIVKTVLLYIKYVCDTSDFFVRSLFFWANQSCHFNVDM